MGKVLSAWVVAASGLVGIGLTFVYPPAAIVVAVLGTMATWLRVFPLNVPATRLAYATALMCLATTLYLCTRSPLLAAAVLPVGLAAAPWELVMRTSRGFFDFQALLGVVLSAALLVAAWPVGWWGLALVPNFLTALMFVQMSLAGRAGEQKLVDNFKIKAGGSMPDVRLPRRDGGGEFSLRDERGHHVLFVFVRGDWCPVCHVMMRIIGREADMLLAKKVKVALVTPSEGDADAEFARQLKLQPGMLLDKDSVVAQSLGLIEREKDGKQVPMPVSVLVGPDGKILNISRPDDVSSFASEGRVLEILRDAPALAA